MEAIRKINEIIINEYRHTLIENQIFVTFESSITPQSTIQCIHFPKESQRLYWASWTFAILGLAEMSYSCYNLSADDGYTGQIEIFRTWDKLANLTL